MRVARSRWLRVGLVIAFAGIAAACSTQARRVDCDGRLEPINQPAPKVKGAPTHEPAAPIQKRDR